MGRSAQAVVIFDSKRVLTYANPAAEALLGYSIDQLSSVSGTYSDQANANDLANIVSRISPPPEIMKRLQPGVAPFFASANATKADGTIFFLPLPQEDSAPMMLGLIDLNAEVNVENSEVGNWPAHSNSTSHFARQIARECLAMWRSHFQMNRFVGPSPASQQVFIKAKAALDSGANLLVHGPQGSGREHLARAIHESWVRNQSPESNQQTNGPEEDEFRFALLACDGRLADPEMIQSTFKELFELQKHLGQPDGRLLLLHAEGLSEAAQNELLGLLRLREYDVRVSATSTVELASLENFDPTLAGLISTVAIEIPALSERIEDIPVLAQAFLEANNATATKQLSGFSEEALECLVQYDWPGNVDELIEMVGDIHKTANGDRITQDDLPKKIMFSLSAQEFPVEPSAGIDLDRLMKQLESEMIDRAMKKAKGNKSKAAELLGINRARLLRKLESGNDKSAS